MSSNVLKSLLDLLYPRFCTQCGVRVRNCDHHLCWDCFAGLNIISRPFCRLCGDPPDGLIEHEYTCSWCNSRKPGFDIARSAARYRGILRDVLHDFKYNGQVHLAADMAELLYQCAKTHYTDEMFDAVLPVPLAPGKERARGFNQAAMLAKRLARRTGISYAAGCVKRVRVARPQVELNAAQRRRNVRGIFEVKEPGWVKGKRLLLVDDVMTTGATVDEVSRMLKNAGAARVCVVTVARG